MFVLPDYDDRSLINILVQAWYQTSYPDFWAWEKSGDLWMKNTSGPLKSQPPLTFFWPWLMGCVIIKMFIYFQIQMFVWSCMLKLQLLIVLLQLSQVTWWLTKKKSCILLFLPGNSLCEESQLRLLCLLWKKLSYVKQKDSCQRTPGPCACICEWARRPLLWAYIAVNEIAGLSHSHVLCVENTFY